MIDSPVVRFAGVGVACSSRDANADVWKSGFIKAPYGRDELAKLGVLTETFETAVNWSGCVARSCNSAGIEM